MSDSAGQGANALTHEAQKAPVGVLRAHDRAPTATIGNVRTATIGREQWPRPTVNDGFRQSAKASDPQRGPQCAAFTHSTGAVASRMTFWIVDPSRNLPTGVRFLVPSTISSAPTSVAVSRI